MSWLTPRAWFGSMRAAPREQALAATLRFLRTEALDRRDEAIALVTKEQIWLAQRLPEYLDEVREETRAGAAASAGALHRSTVAVLEQVDRFTTALAARHPGAASSLALSRLTQRTELLRSLSDSVRELAGVAGAVPASGPIATLTANIAEGLHVVLLTAADAVASPDNTNLELLHHLTADRGQLMDGIRRALLRGEQTLSLDEHQALLTSTSLFERIIRLLRRLRIVLDPVPD